MRHLRNKSGFTLIEIIVVLIVLGVLASIALSQYFSWIKRSYATEALMTLKSSKDQLMTCMRAYPGNETHCSGLIVSSNNFDYISSLVGDGSSIWVIQAKPRAGNRPGLDPLFDNITIGNDVSGNITCSGAGIFLGTAC